ncbi:PAS domain S-box protein [Paenibacillus gansuensis]|uniref:histidine kinase n=1 Tax=Paenibacillus gansuensis TaxID=306542 RepID=A0ABW5PHW9_9BACL
MSIKSKLAVIIVLIITVIFAVVNLLNYFVARDILRKELENQMRLTSGQISIDFQHWQDSNQFVETVMNYRLKISAIALTHVLNPKLEDVTDEELRQAASLLGITNILLFKKTGEQQFLLKSTDSGLMEIEPDTLNYWYKLMSGMSRSGFDVLSNGTANPYWSGSFNRKAKVDDGYDKYGYYYDGTTDYVINPSIDVQSNMQEYGFFNSPKEIIRKSQINNPSLLGLTVFNPRIFQENNTVPPQQDLLPLQYKNRPIYFGDYIYANPLRDVKAVKQAYETGKPVIYDALLEGKRVIKSFYPIQGKTPSVVGLVMDYSHIQETLDYTTGTSITFSFILLFVLFVGVYWMAGWIVKPVRNILNQVNRVAAGNFDERAPVTRRDELGILAVRVNTMSKRLGSYAEEVEQALTELKATQEYLESFINHTSDAVDVTQLDNRVLRINKAFEELYGYTVDEAIGERLAIIPEELIPESDELHARVLAGEQVSGFETVRRRKDGTLIHVSLTVSPIRNKNGDIIALSGISRDITEHRKTEELLRQSDKLTVVGQLAAGVAHEIRNPLTTLRGFVQLLRYQSDHRSEHVELMLSELDRINFIVSEFLVLAKPQAVNYQVRSVRDIVRSVVSLLAPQAILDNIVFRIEEDDDLPLIKCEENQLKQVFINILKNAIEAMPQGGGITIILGKDGSSRVRLLFIDEGIGIPEEQLANVGSPFYTAKDNGTGLGIMVTRRLIENHHGTMDIRSKVGEGTTVEIRLPLTF